MADLRDLSCLGQAYGGSDTGRYGPDPSAMANAAAFRPGELDKLRKLDDQLADCRARRRAAILRAAQMMREG